MARLVLWLLAAALLPSSPRAFLLRATLSSGTQACRAAPLNAKSGGMRGMPSASELAELDLILSGEQAWEVPDEVDWSLVPSNKPIKKAPPAVGPPPAPTGPAAPPGLRMPTVAAGSPAANVLPPNANWRSGTSSAQSRAPQQSSTAANTARTTTTSTPKAPRRATSNPNPSPYDEAPDDLDEADFSYAGTLC